MRILEERESGSLKPRKGHRFILVLSSEKGEGFD